MEGTGKFLTNLIKIYGIVQGVGFRPFVFRLAKTGGLRGFVLNDCEGVKIHLQCQPENLNQFLKLLKKKAPVRSVIQKIEVSQYHSEREFEDFSIEFSRNNSIQIAQVSPDLDVCKECLTELFDPGNRRYLYPFINCTNCGPRFTIIQRMPYDRKNTTMQKFPMCAACRKEYTDPENRRFHAQPNGCFTCGPRLYLTDRQGNPLLSGTDSAAVEEIFSRVSDCLYSGKIIALKGIGGFHLVCDAQNEESVYTLRQRKYREDKPFAVMFSAVHQIGEFCEISKKEVECLQQVAHPIVLLSSKQKVARSVAPKNQYLGCMLPYSPVHHLLMKYFPGPVVMTSGNISDEPVKFSNEEALEQLDADFFLLHNRDINIRCDDSVVRLKKGKSYPIRRSRGYAPQDLDLGYRFSAPVLACGAEQKNVFALAKGEKIYLSHHIGDLKNYEVLEAFETGIAHFQNIFVIRPEMIAVDMHADYLSTEYGKNYAAARGLELFEIQHHHAHAAACMAENKIDEKVVALVMDGTGAGDDGNIWGGEVLICDFLNYERVGHFREVKIPGGESAIKNISAMGAAYLYEIFKDELFEMELPFLQNMENRKIIFHMLKNSIHTPVTTSCGRLFDGVSAICGFRNFVNYEGQAAVELEQQIKSITPDFYSFDITDDNIIDWRPAIQELVHDVKKGEDFPLISEKFHRGLVVAFFELLKKLREIFNINKVVLSGGVFMNKFLLENLENQLINDEFDVYTHHKVPANDGGIALGQLFIADHRNKKLTKQSS